MPRLDSEDFAMNRFGILFFVFAAICAGVRAQAPNQIAAAGYQFPAPAQVAFGQLITLFVRGLNIPDAASNTLPLPTTVSGISVRVKNPPQQAYPNLLPILSVRSYFDLCGSFAGYCDTTAITVQIPTEPTCIDSGFPNSCTIGPLPTVSISVEQSGVAGREFQFQVVARAPHPHILNPCDTIMAHYGGCQPMITHANGRVISTSEAAHPGETIVIYALGLGSTMPSIKSGLPAPSPAPVTTDFIPVSLAFLIETPPGSPASYPLWIPTGQWIQPAFSGLVSGFVGLNQMNIRLPDTLPPGIHQCQAFQDVNTRILLGDGLAEGSMTNVETADICVQP
jgi:hypothetical protein